MGWLAPRAARWASVGRCALWRWPSTSWAPWSGPCRWTYGMQCGSPSGGCPGSPGRWPGSRPAAGRRSAGASGAAGPIHGAVPRHGCWRGPLLEAAIDRTDRDVVRARL